jgi:uncharacterized membrane protein YecN with MAPEG domain
MGNGLGSARRIFGTFCLMVPVGMVILGLTALKHSLDGLTFVVYWLVCFLFTFAAIIIALIDLRSVQRQTREETQELFEKALGDIERQRNEKRGRGA